VQVLLGVHKVPWVSTLNSWLDDVLWQN